MPFGLTVLPCHDHTHHYEQSPFLLFLCLNTSPVACPKRSESRWSHRVKKLSLPGWVQDSTTKMAR